MAYPRGSAPAFTMTTGQQTTGAGSWLDLHGAFSKFSMQCIRQTTGTTAFTVLLQGTHSTASTNFRTLVSYTRAADNSSVKFSTGSIPPISRLRYNVTVLGGTSGVVGFGVRVYAAASL